MIFKLTKHTVFLAVLLLCSVSFAATVTGTVTDDQGSPVANANVKIYKSGVIDSVFTDASGNYTTSDISLNTDTWAYAIKDGYHTGCTRVPNTASPDVDILMMDIMDYTTTISPWVYGGNFYWTRTADWEGLASRVTDVATILRMGGCCWDACEPTEDETWNTRTVDWVLDYCVANNLEPYMQMPLCHHTASEVGEMVQHIVDEGYDVTYYSISNEPERYDQDAGNQYQLTAAEFAEEYRDRYHAIKEVDPTAIVCGFESIGDFWAQMMFSCGDIIDVFSYHNYPYDGSQDVHASLGNPPNYINSPSEGVATMARYTSIYAKREVPFALTEYNLVYDHSASGDAASSSHYAGVWVADVLGRCLAANIYMTNLWCMLNDQSLSIMDGSGNRRPAYWAQYMYKNGFYDQYVTCTAQSPSEDFSYVGVYGSKDDDGNLCLMAVNRHETDNLIAELDFTSSMSNVLIEVPKASWVRIKINSSGSVTEIQKYTESQGYSGPVDGSSLEKTSGADGTIQVDDAESSIGEMAAVNNVTAVKAIAISPNPTQGMTQIRYSLSAKDVPVRAAIYNVRGEKIRSLLHQNQKSGSFELNWDGKNEKGADVTDGVYIVRIKAGNQSLVSKILMTR